MKLNQGAGGIEVDDGYDILKMEKKILYSPNAWSFGNQDSQLISSKGESRIEYDSLTEIGMGAPLGGKCYWVEEERLKYLLGNWCGGPPIWDTQGIRAAIPVWTRKLFKGTIQQILIFNSETKELSRYRKTFSVLDLRTFDNNEICGYDSPIYKTKTFRFNLDAEKIEKSGKVIATKKK